MSKTIKRQRRKNLLHGWAKEKLLRVKSSARIHKNLYVIRNGTIYQVMATSERGLFRLNGNLYSWPASVYRNQFVPLMKKDKITKGDNVIWVSPEKLSSLIKENKIF